MRHALAFILLAYLVREGFEYIVRYLNLRYMGRFGTTVPPEFKLVMDEGVMRKMRDYEADKTRFGFVSSLSGNIITIVFIFGGLLNVLNSWIVALNLSVAISGWLFFLVLFLVSDMVDVPFHLYENFKIENKYGFNTMTPRLWFSDFIKSLLLSVILISVLLFAAFGLMQWSEAHWWLWLWGVMLAYGIIILYISPYVIEPLFNKFSLVEDESLKEKIVGLARRADIKVTKVMKIDASKRSRHSNAYFTGIGKTKRIILFDTLIEGMTQEEIVAVLAHEIGHWKRKHVLKSIVAMETFSLIGLYIAFRLMEGDTLTKLFQVETATVYAKIVIIGFLAGIVAFPLKPVLTYFARRCERQADSDCLELTGNGGDAISAFLKLAKENLSNLYPHPLYVLLYYSHPPMLERIRYMKKEEKTRGSRNVLA